MMPRYGVVLVKALYSADMLCEILGAAVEMRYDVTQLAELCAKQRDVQGPSRGSPKSWNRYWARFDGAAMPFPFGLKDVRELQVLPAGPHLFLPVMPAQVYCLLAAGVPANSFSDIYTIGSTSFAYVAFAEPAYPYNWCRTTVINLHSAWTGSLTNDLPHAYLHRMLVTIKARKPVNDAEGNLLVGMFVPLVAEVAPPVVAAPVVVAVAERAVVDEEKEGIASQVLSELSLIMMNDIGADHCGSDLAGMGDFSMDCSADADDGELQGDLFM